MNKTVKSIEKMLSGTHCKLCLCILLVGMILYILNRFTFRNAEGFIKSPHGKMEGYQVARRMNTEELR